MTPSSHREVKEPDEEQFGQPFAVRWYRYRPIQMAMLSGLFLAVGFVLSSTGLIPASAAIPLYVVAIPLGAFFWMKEGADELVHERVISNEALMAAASVGIAMGGAGKEAALEAADVVLMADDLQKVASAIRLGKQAQAITRQNIVFSLLVLAVLIPGAVTGLLTVTGAVAAHEVSELLAVANGLRVARGP